jgi:hypothetical protein
MEGDVKLIAEGPSRGEGIVYFVVPRGNEVSKLVDQLSADRLTRIGIKAQTGHLYVSLLLLLQKIYSENE